MIYYHVSTLVNNGYNAAVVHNEIGFRLTWLDLKVPVLYFSELDFFENDILVVPEVMATTYDYKVLACEKILFVQGLSYLFFNFKPNQHHSSLGFNKAIIIMPHMFNVVKKYTGLQVYLIPPFIAEYFFKNPEKIHQRTKTILIFPKINAPEYSLIKHLLLSSEFIYPNTFVNRNLTNRWRLIELQGYSHQQTADLMKESSFLITSNQFEAFNTSVPEAMAAGCINFCYNAFGPSDFLDNNKNAYVFENNHAVALVEKLLLTVKNYEVVSSELLQIRNSARNTAETYTLKQMSFSILEFYKSNYFN